jgi:hypothetical protein
MYDITHFCIIDSVHGIRQRFPVYDTDSLIILLSDAGDNMQ